MTKYILTALVLMTSVGCGGGGDTLTEQQTMQALTAMGSATGLSLAAANSEVQITSGQVTVNSSASCPSGGSARASGQVLVNGTSDFQYTLGISMSSCNVGNLTMNGQLDTTGTFNSNGATLSLDGQITFSGGITGTCVFNIDFSVNPQTGSLSYKGKACGRSVNIQLNQQS